ncbi:MAG TPA: hypothetical protein VK121_01585 [Pseudogracilibacillus sp.]|nr:hypothetical protein [Pseudogracilibacillus sp.]
MKRGDFIKKDILAKMMKKALLYRLMYNLDEIVNKSNLTHSDLSSRVGNAKNWFNDAYNNDEDIRISSFVRILSIVDEVGKVNLDKYTLKDFFDDKILKIASLMRMLPDEHIDYVEDFIRNDLNIFIGLLADWRSLEYRKKLTKGEQNNLTEINNLINFLKKENV